MPSEKTRVPPYFDLLIEYFDTKRSSRFVHWGHWENHDEAIQQGFDRGQNRLNDMLIDMAGIDSGMTVLDIGCGLGGTLASINAALKDMTLIGVNIDPRQLEICEQLEPGDDNSLEWVTADALSLPFEDESFDRVLCIEAMFHFASRTEFFREVSRVMRPGGILVASDIVVNATIDDIRFPDFLSFDAVDEAYGPWPDPTSTAGSHSELAQHANLHELELIDATRFTLPTHQFTTPSNVRLDSDTPVEIRAAMTLRWLQEQNLLNYWYMSFQKSGKN